MAFQVLVIFMSNQTGVFLHALEVLFGNLSQPLFSHQDSVQLTLSSGSGSAQFWVGFGLEKNLAFDFGFLPENIALVK